MYDMINIFETFLPQLLRYPNPTDPLNGEAAALMMRDPKAYEVKVEGKYLYLIDTWIQLAAKIPDYQTDYVKRFASKDAADEAGGDDESEDEMSSVGSYHSGEDEEPAGNMDEL